MAKWEGLFAADFGQIGSAALEEGAAESYAASRQQCAFVVDSGEAAEAGAAADSVEDGFDVVVGVVGDKDVFGGDLQGDAFEELIASFACPFFGCFWGFDGWIGLDSLDVSGQAEFIGEVFDETGVLVGVGTAHAVVEVGDVDFPVELVAASDGSDGAEEQYGVESAGDSDDVVCGSGVPISLLEPVGEQFEECFPGHGRAPGERRKFVFRAWLWHGNLRLAPGVGSRRSGIEEYTLCGRWGQG